MTQSMNRVQLIGRIGSDVSTVIFDDGKIKSRFPISTSENYNDGDERITRTQWHDIVGWGAIAETHGQWHKGDLVMVEGRLTYRTYEDGEGVTRYITEIVCTRCMHLASRNSVE